MSDRPEKINLSDVHSRQVDTDLLNELRDLFVKAEEQKERYDFTWNGKAKAYFEAAAPTTKTLRAQPEESVNFEGSENLFITGDNLEALKLLQESYLGKIDMIYIDPPYNTGKDFVYQDNFKKTKKENDLSEGILDEEGDRLVKNEKSNGRYHSDWLTMIYPRLKLARNLLSDSGIIFVSIDENEIANLELLLTEIFGENNLAGTIVWDKRNPKGDSKGVSMQHGYIVAAAKNINIFSEFKEFKRPKKNAEIILNKSKEIFKKINDKFTLSDANEEYRKWINSKKDLSGGEKAYSKLDEKGNVYREVSMAAPDKPEKRSHRPLTHPLTGKQTSVPAKGWRYIDKTMDKLLQQDLVIFGSDEKTIPNQKYLLVENMMEKLPSLYYNGASGSGDITKIGFKQNIFDNPKPVDLIRQLIVSTTKKNEVILDFFAGSGTTADAVMQTNSEDGGNRKFIVATLDEETPENSEARKVGYSTIDQISRERIRRAAEKIGDTSGFRTLKVDSTGLKEDVFKTAGELDQVDLLQDIDNHSDNRSDYDLLYDVLVDGALEYNRPITIDTMNDEQIIKYDYLGELSGVVCYFGENLTDELTRQIAILKPLLAVFKESTFDKSAQKVNVMEQFRIISPDTKVKVI